ncbi:threonine/serine exporter family protein [Kineothrix alysoides]|uniref:threonine/serine exporter family protein n=1 Tax=Kineothrix alysoides TaxID=1469948 RepID=UPI00241865EC|nr:threonine/serine exporter family protein [Kineothrix alysoides]
MAQNSRADVNRAEDSITRICKAYGIDRIDVLTITATIVVTIYGEQFGSITQTRRIQGKT